MSESSPFNQDITRSCSDLSLYQGDMTLVPHDGDTRSGTGTIHLFCGGAQRHLRVNFDQTDGKSLSTLPRSPDGKFGRGTTHMQLPLASIFFVFVTSGARTRPLVGESRLITADPQVKYRTLELYVLNTLIPANETTWTLGDWSATLERTPCSYDLTRVSLPINEINLTHRLVLHRKDGLSFSWSDVQTQVDQFLLFLSFANCSQVTAPISYGRTNGALEWFRFEAPDRTFPTNRRSWATKLTPQQLEEARECFMSATENPFWGSIIRRAVSWLALVDLARYESDEQALFTVQMLLEMLSYVVLVEDAAVLSEDGYSKLPAADRITVLCGYSNQSISVTHGEVEELRTFCASNSIGNTGELIAALRNKLIHPTKKNREYLARVPSPVRRIAVDAGLQIASLTVLKTIGYRGAYYDTSKHHVAAVPWSR
jgi:hypothetical protein